MARPIELMESPAYRVLTLSAHRALSRIEVEYSHHAGQDNGKLPVTFDDFADYGVHRTAIGPALAELEALGFIKITEHGKMARAAEYRSANKFLLMARPPGKNGIVTHGGWSRFKTMGEAEAAAVEARQRYGKEKAASTENVPEASTENVLKTAKRQYGNRTTTQCGNRTTSISRDVGVGRGQSDPPSPRYDACKPDGVVTPFIRPISPSARSSREHFAKIARPPDRGMEGRP